MKGGKKVHEQIDQAIRMYDKLLLVLSEASMSSGWVKFEIRKAMQREKVDGRRILFPIRLMEYDCIQQCEWYDGKIGVDLTEGICQYFIPDFSDWKDNEAFEAAFEKLLYDLKAVADHEA